MRLGRQCSAGSSVAFNRPLDQRPRVRARKGFRAQLLVPPTIGVPMWTAAVLLLLVILLVFSTFRILLEYERGVVFLLGRLWKVKGPGLIIIVPGIQKMVRVDLRTRVFDVPPQDVISRDNVSVKVNAVLYLPRHRRREGHHPGRALRSSDKPARTNDAALHRRPTRP